MLRTDGETNHVFSDTTVDLLLIIKLLVGGRPGVDRKSLGVTDTIRAVSL